MGNLYEDFAFDRDAMGGDMPDNFLVMVLNAALIPIAGWPADRRGRFLGKRLEELVSPRFLDSATTAITEALGDQQTRTITVESPFFKGFIRIVVLPTGIPETPIILSGQCLPEGWGRLTPREIDVIRVTKVAKDPEEAARMLGISRHTLHSHRRSICAKLLIDSASQFYAWCSRYG